MTHSRPRLPYRPGSDEKRRTTVRSETRKSSAIYAILFTEALGVIAPATVGANDCPAILPAFAGAVGEPRLCHAGDDKRDGLFVCREYRDADRVYRVLFRGGPAPKQVYELTRDDATATQLPVRGRRCELARPPGVPVAASYRGTGVCADEHGRPLPCSLFEHAGAREPEAMRYFVFYEPDGNGIRRIDALSVGRNEHALEAELAFHLGQALAGSTCCRDRARDYVAYATALFPDDGAYRAALTAQMSEGAGAQSTPMTAFSRMLDQLQ
jgi:hypothetical protein